MLGEFTSITVPKCKEIITKQIAITSNTGVDDIDLSVLDTDASALAATAFMNPYILGASEVIARKEAYDFSRAHTRLSKVYLRDRSSYYSTATAELDVEDKYVDHQESLFLKYLEFSKV